MRDSWTAAKVGLLVVGALVASWFVYRAVDERGGGDGGYTVWVVFQDASGLVPKSRVLVAGIQVGYIERIRLWGAKARIDIHVREGVTEEEFVQMRTSRDATLEMPVLIMPSVQVNIRAGELPPPEANGVSYLKIPLNAV